MHENTAWSREGGGGVGGSATLCLLPALPPNTCSLSKGGPVTPLLPEKMPDFNVYLSPSRRARRCAGGHQRTNKSVITLGGRDFYSFPPT